MKATQQQFNYQIWLPGQAPSSGEPSLTLHDGPALRFFVQAGSLLFADTPFCVSAYYIANELMERPVANGRYQLHRIHQRIELYAIEEHGIRAEQSSRNLITAALGAACEQRQVL